MAQRRLNNATTVYLAMLLVFAVGMWAVLVAGAALRAPPDLAGEWELIPKGAARDTNPLHLTLEQSGRFARLRIRDGQSYDLRMTQTAPIVRFIGRNGIAADFAPGQDARAYRLTLNGLGMEHREFTARLATRAHPRTPTASSH